MRGGRANRCASTEKTLAPKYCLNNFDRMWKISSIDAQALYTENYACFMFSLAHIIPLFVITVPQH